jgi:hypothetical protein
MREKRMTVKEAAELFDVSAEQAMDIFAKNDLLVNDDTELSLEQIRGCIEKFVLFSKSSNIYREYIQRLKNVNNTIEKMIDNYENITRIQKGIISSLKAQIKLRDNYHYFYQYPNWYESPYNKEPESNKISGFVYLAYDERYYKIGATKDLENRRKRLRTGNVKLEIIASVQSDNAFKLENTLHNIFSEKNIDLEWFDLNDDDIDILVKLFGFKRYICTEPNNDTGTDYRKGENRCRT